MNKTDNVKFLAQCLAYGILSVEFIFSVNNDALIIK